MKPLLKGVPTNVVTGFLGAGKSTAIQGFIRQKQLSERWAVLVNEFGEVGVDGGLLAGEQPNDVVIREVPGGCMCCTAGLPMQWRHHAARPSAARQIAYRSLAWSS